MSASAVCVLPKVKFRFLFSTNENDLFVYSFGIKIFGNLRKKQIQNYFFYFFVISRLRKFFGGQVHCVCILGKKSCEFCEICEFHSDRSLSPTVPLDANPHFSKSWVRTRIQSNSLLYEMKSRMKFEFLNLDVMFST